MSPPYSGLMGKPRKKPTRRRRQQVKLCSLVSCLACNVLHSVIFQTIELSTLSPLHIERETKLQITVQWVCPPGVAVKTFWVSGGRKHQMVREEYRD
jgi:hypothetical protein